MTDTAGTGEDAATTPFEWDHFLQLAEEWSVDPRQAVLRSAISRAYYAAYIPACNKNLAKRNFNDLAREVRRRNPKAGSHDVTWGAYGVSGQRLSRRVSELGQRMKDRRIGADYEDETMFRASHQLVRATINDAREVIKSLRVL
ncbi:MAG TPA: hypothetical protein VFJ58_17855 [Armatimonadota bacterium]|nr:hypothetical protein [Armatimonadota bacterium]